MNLPYYTARPHTLRPLLCAGALCLAAFANPAAAQTIGVDSSSAETEEQATVADPLILPDEAPEGAVSGMGDINLYPRRVVLGQRQRIATIGLYNKVPAPGEYEISMRDMVMTPEGGLFPVDNLPDGVTTERLSPASEMLRWSPRRVRLLGSESQTVRVMARPPADLPDGEYRAHFMVTSVPQDVDEGFSIDNATGTASNSGIGVMIRPRFAISIPVIMRVGETTLDLGIENIGLTQTDGATGLSLTITRAGTRSAFGDLLVTVPGSDEPLLEARGVGIYPEVDARTLSLPINPEFDTTLLRSGAVLSIRFVDDDFAPGDVLASRDFVVP